jgi:hypothetical protein
MKNIPPIKSKLLSLLERIDSSINRVVMGSALGVGVVATVITSLAVFFSVWSYFINLFGLFWGVAHGWVPAGIVTFITYVLMLVLSPLVGVLIICGVGYWLYVAPAH